MNLTQTRYIVVNEDGLFYSKAGSPEVWMHEESFAEHYDEEMARTIANLENASVYPAT